MTAYLIWVFYILRKFELSLAFPIAASSILLLSQIIGITLLGEQMSLEKTIGILFITVGTVLVGRTL